jgi:hypothetical protein
MPVESPGTLDEEIDRCKIARHKIEVKIERLLHHLGSDQKFTSPIITVTVLSKFPEHLLLDSQSITHSEPGMEEHYILFTEQSGKLLERQDRIINGIPNPAGTLTLVNDIQDPIHHLMMQIGQIDLHVFS